MNKALAIVSAADGTDGGGDTSAQYYDPAFSGDAAPMVDVVTEVRREAALLKTGALQDAIFNSANFSSIATDENGSHSIIQRRRRAHAGLRCC